ncbi:DUF6844 domain-containing protein [Halodesulfovibrio aestuarii]|uniref:DUF6844 domain-containing protein n=1 Tax=Halodesulfovibrio aestuarii TaxID=126333 RepID=A0ABV4JQC3_9BACT
MQTQFSRSAKRYIAAFIAIFLLPSLSFAQGSTNIEAPAPATQEQAAVIEEAVAEAAVPQVLDPRAELDELISIYNGKGKGALFLEKQDQGQIFYTVSRARVKVSADHPDWANFRTMAFEEAYLKAQAEYMKFLGVSVRAAALQSIKEDPTMPEFTREELGSTNKFEEILEKAVAVVGSKLDNMLSENGIDPEKFKALPREKKKELLRNTIEKRTVTTASAELSGMIPVQTFEANNSEGRHEVAVAVVASPKFKSWISSIIANKGDLRPNPRKVGGPSVRSIVGNKPAALFQQFGIRRIYNQDGYPVLVSYGQAGNAYTGTDYDERAEGREMAMRHADAQAYANFAFLFKSHGMFSQDAGRKEVEKTVGTVEQQADGSIFSSKERSKEFISTLNQTINAKGCIKNLPGVRKLTSWTYKHPEYNQEIVGVIYTWSPQSSKLATDLKKTVTAKKTAAAPHAKKQVSPNAVMGQEMMDVDDF